MGRSFSKAELIASFNDKVRQGLYAIETVPCLCGSHELSIMASRDHFGLWCPIVLCKRCGLVFANPRLTADAYEQFYASNEYRFIYDGEDYLEHAEKHFEDGYGEHIFADVAPIMQQRGLSTVLEIGCGAGWNLAPFKRQGYEVLGYDYSPTLVSLGKKRGLNLLSGSFNVDSAKKYDVIILNHVIEHFPNIIDKMKEIINKLNHQGIIYIGVPNVYKYLQFVLPHVYYFSPKTFAYYIQMCGLRSIKSGSAQDIHMFGIFEISNCPKETVSLNNEYYVMMVKILKYKLKSRLTCVLEKLNLKDPLKKFLAQVKNLVH